MGQAHSPLHPAPDPSPPRAVCACAHVCRFVPYEGYPDTNRRRMGKKRGATKLTGEQIAARYEGVSEAWVAAGFPLDRPAGYLTRPPPPLPQSCVLVVACNLSAAAAVV